MKRMYKVTEDSGWLSVETGEGLRGHSGGDQEGHAGIYGVVVGARSTAHGHSR